jgi:hypothetical protein
MFYSYRATIAPSIYRKATFLNNGIQFTTETTYFSFFESMKTGSVTHVASYPVGNVCSFFGEKVAGA